MENADKLPKWAQHNIILLEREIERLNETVQSFNTADSDITYGYPISHGLPKHSTVHFLVDGVRFDVNVTNGILRVYSTDTIAVVPNASNVVSIVPFEK